MADERKIAITTQDTNGNPSTSSFSGINPALNETNQRVFITGALALIDGQFVSAKVTDETILYPEAGE